MPSPPRILVVDDDVAALELIAHTLESLDTAPKCVPSSRAAVELVDEEKFDGVFLDWMMPELDGLEVARRIRQSKFNRNVPIVMLTAKTEPEAMERAFQAGIQFFLTKPVTSEKVKRLLEASRGLILAERRRYRRVAVSLDVRCAWDGERVRGTTVNLSHNGILLQIEKLPPVGASIALEVALPGRSQRLELMGKVVRLVKGVGIGVQFTAPRDADHKVLASFLDTVAEAPRRVLV